MNETYQDLEIFLTKDRILGEGWEESGQSPNGCLYHFTKGKWRLKFYKNDRYMAPIELSYFVPEEEGTYDSYSRWTDPFSFDCKNIATFRFICKLLGI